MKIYKLFGENTKLSQTAQYIMDENIAGLEETLGKEWELNQKIEVCEFVEEYPINLALIENKLKVIDYFLLNGCELNHPDSPAIVTAARNCSEDTILNLLKHDSKIDLSDSVGKNAYSAALYSERYDLLNFFLVNGLSIENDKGKSFRQAVYKRQLEAIHFFLNNGIDPNIRTPDMVMPYNPTAVSVAASNNDFDLVKTLVSKGADITLPDAYGDRPYLIAVKNKNYEMAEFFKNLEPQEWHDEAGYITKLRA
ncbi:ankyrin repeat domain-containing protein [Pseudoalteromonas sp.]|uniref:ankyrin repeat domain-containing protein n=1 Tax=Pseudoalteromonas sp. TaxID=53249 RepID=UPI003567E306